MYDVHKDLYICIYRTAHCFLRKATYTSFTSTTKSTATLAPAPSSVCLKFVTVHAHAHATGYVSISRAGPEPPSPHPGEEDMPLRKKASLCSRTPVTANR